MKLVKTVNKVTKTKDVPGLLNVALEHAIKESTGRLQYTGPYISPEVWHGLLSFFRWSYETTKSEAQARFYVNIEEGKWAAWAYPQEAGCGLSTKEVDTPEAKTQRAQFGDEWLYFGTEHHHCEMSAFQSGTDEANERDMLGLHVTIGHITAARVDLHARFYIDGCCFEPDLSEFWDIGDRLRSMIPQDLWDKVARHQMSEKVEAPFPEEWKANLIKRPELPMTSLGLGYSPTKFPDWSPHAADKYSHLHNPAMVPERRVKAAAREALRHLDQIPAVLEDDVQEALDALANNPVVEVIVNTADMWNMPASAVATEILRRLDDQPDPNEQTPKRIGNGDDLPLGHHWE